MFRFFPFDFRNQTEYWVIGITQYFFPVKLFIGYAGNFEDEFLNLPGYGPRVTALPVAVGVKLTPPKRAVCVLAGDGGFQLIKDLTPKIDWVIGITQQASRSHHSSSGKR